MKADKRMEQRMEADKRMNLFGGRGALFPCFLVSLFPPRLVSLSRWRLVSLFSCLLVSLLLLSGCNAPVVVEWSTETELNTAGFNLYRGTAEVGPFDVKVNEQLIPASPDPLTGGKYSYVDRTARAGAMYYYQLQEVERTGAVNTHGPIAVRAGGFDWRLAAVLGVLATGVLVLWIKGGRQAARKV